MSAPLRLTFALAALGLASPVLADEPPAKVRASHRVDVIAPGERVETVIDRLRAARPQPATEARPQLDRPVRPPDGRPAGERPAPRAGARHEGPHDGGGAPQPTGTSPPPPPPPDHTGSRTDRPHR